MAKNQLIDLYSDTATRPTPGMRKAMAEAEVGDEQRGEDPSTSRLQDRVAELLGKEAAVFLPSGTMCNQIALLVHCRPGDEIIGAENTHVFTSEAGGGSALAGVQTWPIPSERGIFTGAALTAAWRDPGNRHNPRSRLVVIEQTNNRGGGAVWPLAAIAEVSAAARKLGLIVHMDGARILNAAIALGVPARDMTRHVDSVWLDLSKGLGCPIGGVLAGTKEFINEAWRWKHRLGGAMRQSGIVAAAGLYALDHNVARLKDDHANARRLAERIAEIPGLKPAFAKVDTNIVFFSVTAEGLDNAEVTKRLLQENVRMGTSYGGLIRAVTHHDVSAEEIEMAADALAKVLTGGKGRKR